MLRSVNAKVLLRLRACLTSSHVGKFPTNSQRPTETPETKTPETKMLEKKTFLSGYLPG